VKRIKPVGRHSDHTACMAHSSYAMGQACPIAITAPLPLHLGLLLVDFAVIGPPPGGSIGRHLTSLTVP
jgi:hypothetical protein